MGFLIRVCFLFFFLTCLPDFFSHDYVIRHSKELVQLLKQKLNKDSFIVSLDGGRFLSLLQTLVLVHAEKKEQPLTDQNLISGLIGLNKSRTSSVQYPVSTGTYSGRKHLACL